MAITIPNTTTRVINSNVLYNDSCIQAKRKLNIIQIYGKDFKLARSELYQTQTELFFSSGSSPRQL